MFAVVFLAIYTANLAAFMITREEFHEFTGLDDTRLSRPYSHKPSIKFGTIPYSHTDSTIAKYFREMHYYMREWVGIITTTSPIPQHSSLIFSFNKTSVAEGVASVLNGQLDAFIYDGTVLDYLVQQDEDCRLLTVGQWYAMTVRNFPLPKYCQRLHNFSDYFRVTAWHSVATQNTFKCSTVLSWNSVPTVISSDCDATGWLANVDRERTSIKHRIHWHWNNSCPLFFFLWPVSFLPPYCYSSNTSTSNTSANDWQKRIGAGVVHWFPYLWENHWHSVVPSLRRRKC